ncbi:hypothetical protein MTR67_052053 [Solanum verrucosum]|uniref:Uncharacterized protein n=1 Tax=Solanum verrucosum TaxID=315347 RepID=A0AAF1A2L4_SOLVR|nr:hypothetical protein MTR67_052053 [Solanum verrucosum]
MLMDLLKSAHDAKGNEECQENMSCFLTPFSRSNYLMCGESSSWVRL